MNGNIEQVSIDVISQVSSPASQLHQWLTDLTQRQHVAAAADRLNKLGCDCTFCLPNVTVASSPTFKSSSSTTTSTTTTTTTTTSNKPVFSCASCSRSFTSKKYLNMHSALHRKTTSNSTAGPAEPVTSIQPLALSRSTAAATATLTGKDRWTCEVCGKVFAHNSNYKNHIRTHSDERPFVCHVCSIGFKERYHLKKHTLFKHTGELNEACRRCGKRFKDSTAVRAHERIHSDARPYSCQRCGKAFKTSECLWHHDHRSKTCGRPRRTAARQSAVMPATYQTSLQSVSADSLVSLTDLLDQSQSHSALSDVDIKSLLSSQPLSLTTPSTVTHVDSSNYIPAVKTEDSVFMLNTAELQGDVNMMPNPISVPWLQSHSNKPVAVVIGQHVTGSGVKQRSVCSRCGKQFASSPAFERHLAVHSLTRPYRCHICDVGFKLKVHLKKHNLYRHNNDYPCQCKVCGKPFKDSSAVRLHERIHSSARPFQCACGKSFKTRENLWGHRHRRPCVGRYAAGPTSTSACLQGEVKTSRVDVCTSSGVESLPVSAGRFTETTATSMDLRQFNDNNNSTAAAAAAAAVMYSDGLLSFDSVPAELRDCFGVDSKLLPPFETFIPPLHSGGAETPTSNATSAAPCHHGFTDWPPVPLPHDVIWWPSNLQASPTMMTSQLGRSDLTDDWSSDWQLSRKLSL